MASCREMTDCGTTRRSVAGGGGRGLGRARPPRGPPRDRRPCSMSRRSDLAASETTASSARSERSEVSRAAVCARISAIPSRRLSCSARWASLLVPSARTRVRSSRASSATTWNFVRTEGITRPRWTAASTSRTVRASTGMMPSLSRSRHVAGCAGAVRRAADWRWPRRATDSSSPRAGLSPADDSRNAAHRRNDDVEQSGRSHRSTTSPRREGLTHSTALRRSSAPTLLASSTLASNVGGNVPRVRASGPDQLQPLVLPQPSQT